jgi:hypothetical protein
LPWIYFHKVIGVSTFYLFVEGKAASPNVSRVLETIPGVKVIYRTKELEEKQAKSRIWNETWLSSFFYKPCNYELFVKQSLNMEMAITMAQDAGMEWIIHLDTDELIHPSGTHEYSLRKLLGNISADVDVVIFPNYVSLTVVWISFFILRKNFFWLHQHCLFFRRAALREMISGNLSVRYQCSRRILTIF